MYNTTLLEEFEDDTSRAGVTPPKFEETETDGNLETGTNGSRRVEEPAEEIEAQQAAEEIRLASGDTESWSDDPVRMYLTQMGEIPLLTRQEEIRLAKKIELTRQRFRRRLLECDYVIQAAFKVLQRVHLGELPFDRTVQVSVTDRLEKDQILGRISHNLRTGRGTTETESPRPFDCRKQIQKKDRTSPGLEAIGHPSSPSGEAH